MDVKDITVHLRYSANVNGAWKTLELGATAAEGLGGIAPLYEELAARLKLLFPATARRPRRPPRRRWRTPSLAPRRPQCERSKR